MSTSDQDLNLHMIGVPGFLGAFPISKIPSFCPLNNGFISNFEDFPGSHWVAVVRQPSGLYYFDSFGYPPPLKILKTLKNTSKTFYYSIPEYQKFSSDNCGEFCVDFLTRALGGMPAHLVTKRTFLPHPSSYNEREATNFFNRK